MKVFKEKSMHKGWFVGNFSPTCVSTKEAEVAVKRYSKGEQEFEHYHKIATEITFVISGKISMNGVQYSEGEIIVIDPKESVVFEAIEDSINVVVKIPGELNDKYKGKYKG